MSDDTKMESATSQVMATMTVFTAEEFDFKAVKKMTSFDFEESETRIVSWPILHNLHNWTAAELGRRVWQSDRFRLKDNIGFGQLSLKNWRSEWVITLRIDDTKEAKTNGTYSAYFICKYTFEDGENTVTKFGPLMTTIDNAVFSGWKYEFDPSTLMRSVLVEMYQISAALPNYVAATSCVAVGKIVIPKAGSYNKLTGYPSFNFGSAEQNMVVNFKNDGKASGLTAILYVKNNRAPGVPLTFTFTIFSVIDTAKDVVKTIVLRREEKGFEHSFLFALYEELDALIEKHTLYYKVVLQPGSSVVSA